MATAQSERYPSSDVRGTIIVRDAHATRRARTLACIANLAGEGSSSDPILVLQGVSADDRPDELLDHKLPVVVYGDGAAHWPIRTKAKLLLAGARTVLDSSLPTFEVDLLETIAAEVEAAQQITVRHAEARMALAVGRLIGSSPAIFRIGEWLARVALLRRASTLITGETGTGKELVARALHALDTERSHQPFVALNCASLPAPLLESELFGYRRGAFTGAASHREGLLQAAHQGVLFLDEVGELDLSVQAKLLRAIQEGRFRPLGSDREVATDVRIVAATNRSLEAMVEAQTFRGDLLHRLAVLTVELPALRERREDIPLLVHHFLGKWAEVAGRTVPVLADDLMEALTALEYPGNVRQLEHLVVTLLAQGRTGARIELADLPRARLAQLAESKVGDPTSFTADGAAAEHLDRLARAVCDGRQDLHHALLECERVLVQAAWLHARRNQTQAARLLGLTPRSVYTKLRRLGLLR